MKNNQKGSTTIIILVALIAILIIGGVYLITSRSKAPANNVQNAVGTASTSASLTTTATTTPSVSSGSVSQVKLYYVDFNDNGKNGMQFGCNDSLVPIITTITPTQAPLKAALEALFADHNQYEGTNTNIMNSLYQSHLKVDSASVSDTVAHVKISGTVAIGGVCDDPRFVNQIKYTVLQFPTVTSAVITVNGKALESYLSEKGE